MKIIDDNYKKIHIEEDITLTMGNFDGLHLGHQQLIQQLFEYPDTKHAVMTFDPHPATILRQHPFKTLTQKEDKIALFKQYPLDYIIIAHFDKDFSHLSVAEFIDFLKKIRVKRMIVGRDARFAYRGEGTVLDLEKNFEVVILDDLLYQETRISTTYIKDFLAAGDVLNASHLLRRYYTIKGEVVHGNRVGTSMGFPTANIDFANYFIPKDGVYYTRILIRGKWYESMTNIGNNPTINYSVSKKLEVYILDFKETIYGEMIEIAFHHYLRPEIKYPSKEALIVQLKKDEENVRLLSKQ